MSSTIRTVHTARDLGVVIDSSLSMTDQVSAICRAAYYQRSSAFDTVDHQTLLPVLRCRFGVTDAALSWCSSYLSQRTQIFNTNEQLSGPHVIGCIPQGSALVR